MLLNTSSVIYVNTAADIIVILYTVIIFYNLNFTVPPQ